MAAVSSPAKEKKNNFLKGQSREIFDLQFFSWFDPTWATDLSVKIFSILVKNSLSYAFWVWYTMQRVNLPGYDTPTSQSPWSIIPRRFNKNPPKYDSPGYHTPVIQFFKLKIRTTSWNLNQNRKYFNPVADSNTNKWSRKSRWTVPLRHRIKNKCHKDTNVWRVVHTYSCLNLCRIVGS